MLVLICFVVVAFADMLIINSFIVFIYPVVDVELNLNALAILINLFHFGKKGTFKNQKNLILRDNFVFFTKADEHFRFFRISLYSKIFPINRRILYSFIMFPYLIDIAFNFHVLTKLKILNMFRSQIIEPVKVGFIVYWVLFKIHSRPFLIFNFIFRHKLSFRN